jgi:HPt (histidine-containing phosphotransfer) domain-containing protein
VLDQRHFSEMTGGDLALQREVVGLFRGQVADWRSALTETGNPEAWRETAHKLKGSARAIGLWPLGAACEAVEQAPTEQAREKLALVRNLLDEALADLSVY